MEGEGGLRFLIVVYHGKLYIYISYYLEKRVGCDILLNCIIERKGDSIQMSQYVFSRKNNENIVIKVLSLLVNTLRFLRLFLIITARYGHAYQQPNLE